MAEMNMIGVLDGLPDLKIRSTLKITAAPRMIRRSLRIGTAGLDAAGKVLGLTLPLDPCRAAEGEGRAALALGPDEWLLLAPENDPAFAALEAALTATPHSLVDISHRQTALEISGSRAEALLNAGIMLDLRLPAFPVGMCARTLLGKAEVVLWRRQANTFHVEVWRSFAPYVHQFLTQASLGL